MGGGVGARKFSPRIYADERGSEKIRNLPRMNTDNTDRTERSGDREIGGSENQELPRINADKRGQEPLIGWRSEKSRILGREKRKSTRAKEIGGIHLL